MTDFVDSHGRPYPVCGTDWGKDGKKTGGGVVGQGEWESGNWDWNVK